MPPPIGAFSSFSSGISETSASVVSRSDAIDAAFCSAERTTLVGSMTPASTRFSYSSVERVEALVGLHLAHLRDDDRALEPGVAGDLPERLLERAADDRDADRLVARRP